MNSLYIKERSAIESLGDRLTDFLDNLPDSSDDRGMEEDYICDCLYRLNQALEDTKYAIEYCCRETIEGYLKESTDVEGRYCVKKNELTCGRPLEVFLWGKWYKGRVEYSDEYYFVGAGNPPLAELMKKKVKVRIRV